VNKTEEINALSSEGINSRKSDHEQNIVSLESNLKTLLDFKNSLLEDQKNGEQTIQELNEKIEITKKQIDEERETLEGLRIKLKEVNDVKEYFGRRRSANNSSNNSGSLTFSGSGALGSLASLLNLLTESVDAAEVISIPHERTQILSYYDCFILCSSQPTHCREVDRAK